MLPLRLLAALAGLSLALSSLTSAAEPAPVLRLRADSWMPYNGEPGATMPGYGIQLVQEIFSARGVTVDYQMMPWVDALEAAKAGEITAVIGANAEEGEGLVFPEESIGAPQICLMTPRDSKWAYESVRTLRDRKLGVIEGYSYWPGLDKYIASVGESHPNVLVAGGESPLTDLLDALNAGQIDVLVESEIVLLWELRQRGQKSTDYRVVYKNEPDPVYVAFCPTDEGRRWAALFDEGLRELRANGRLAEILRSYGLRDWQ